MLIYKYSPTTGELIGSRSTIKPEQPGVNETDITPPVCLGTEIPIFANGAWTVTPDHRRIIYYRKADQQPIRLALGATPDATLTRVKPLDKLQIWNEESNAWVYPLDVQKQFKTKDLFRECDAKVNEVLQYYPETEPDTWPEKTKMSEQWAAMSAEQRLGIISDPTYRLMFGMLFAEAVGKYNPVEADIAEITSLAQRILRNKTGFGIYAGLVMKAKTDFMRLITAATTEAELNAIVIDLSQFSLLTVMSQLSG